MKLRCDRSSPGEGLTDSSSSGLFNTTTAPSSAPVTISTTAAAIGLPPDPDGYLVQDLWGQQSVVSGGASAFQVSSAGVIQAAVPAEGVALYQVIPLP